MRRIPWRLLAAAVFTAILLDSPFPNAGPLRADMAMFAWTALVGLLVGLLRLPDWEAGHSPGWRVGWSFLAGWLCGAVWFGTNCYWVYDTMHLYGGMNVAMAALSLVLFSLFLGVWFGAFALVLALVREATRGGRLQWLGFVAIPFLWVGMEFAISRIPSFPWDELGYSQIENGLLMRLVPWTGVMGVSFVVASINAVVAAGLLRVWRTEEGVLPRRVRFQPSDLLKGGIPVVLLIGFVISGGVLFKPPEPPAQATAMLMQPNLDVVNDDVWVGREWDRQIAQFKKLAGNSCAGFLNGMPDTGAMVVSPACTDKDAAPALIVWPESPAPFRGADPSFQAAMADVVKADGAPLIVGNIAMDADPATQQETIYNAGSVFALDGHLVGRYDKIHLVPFGEYVPARGLLFFVHQLTQQLTDLGRGTERKTFRIAGADGNAHRYGIFICYESVFGDEVRQFVQMGAEVLVNISDDGWYGDTSAPWQHLNMARMRAIENRRWILRDTNSGVTAAIDPYGTVRQSIPRHQVGALAAQFGYGNELTFYTQHGDWLGVLCAIFALGITVWAIRVLLRSRWPLGDAYQPH